MHMRFFVEGCPWSPCGSDRLGHAAIRRRMVPAVAGHGGRLEGGNFSCLSAPRRRGADGELAEAHGRSAGHIEDVVVERTEHARAKGVGVELAVVLGSLRWRA